LWEVPLAHAGLGGIAATERYVVFGDRDLDDFHDVFRCLDADTGEPLWEVQRLAIAALDYGNTPRATPLIEGEFVYCLGAHGHLLCIRLADGHVSWEKNFRDEFPLREGLPWGYCGSPLLADGKLIVSPGAAEASLVAIDPDSGVLKWRTAGGSPSYGSLTAGIFGDVKQIVGHDANTLGGWDIETGKRLWTVKPVAEGDFNVPTPIAYNGQLIIATENNGTRRFDFASAGRIVTDPVARNDNLRPDMSTPVVVGNRLFCAKDFLYCLDLDDDLAERWRIRDRAIGDYAAIIASQDRLLVIGKGQLLLLPTDGQRQIIGRQKVFDEKVNVYSHPALVGNRLYIRGESRLLCLQL
jgi:outer membrane protein assembly factor BamB